MTKHRELENQLYEAKLAQAAAILKEEQEKNNKEKELVSFVFYHFIYSVISIKKQIGRYQHKFYGFFA